MIFCLLSKQEERPVVKSQHLNHPTMQFIGTNQSFMAYAADKNMQYNLGGDQGLGYSATAHLVIEDPKAFHASIQLGKWSDVMMEHIWASSYTFDANHDLLKLYQGNKVVDTISLHVPGATGSNAGLMMQSNHNAATGDAWVYFGTGYHGLSFGVSQHGTVAV